MDPPANSKLSASSINDFENESSITSSETYSCKISFQRNMCMLGILYFFSSQSSYMWRNALKQHHTLLFVFITLIFVTAGISLLNVRFHRNLGLNIFFIHSLVGCMFTGCCCLSDSGFSIVFYAISNVAFVCSTACVSAQELFDSTRSSGLLAATVSTLHSALLYYLYNLRSEIIQKIHITILLSLETILIMLPQLSNACPSSNSENRLRYGSAIISCAGILDSILEAIKLQKVFSFISPACISVVLFVFNVMGSFEINRRDFERFERSLVNPKLALFASSLIVVAAAANHSLSQILLK